MEPPPAPIVWMSRDGNRTGYPPIDRCAAGAGSPPCTRHTSVLVPPMSKVMASGKPLATAAAAAARTPAAGPDRRSAAGSVAATAAGRSPPAELITSTDSARSSRSWR